jgi:hypothetical protein
MRGSVIHGSFGRVDMAKSDQKKEIELHPDAWQRFERAANVVAKSPPQHRATKVKRKPRRKKTKSVR